MCICVDDLMTLDSARCARFCGSNKTQNDMCGRPEYLNANTVASGKMVFITRKTRMIPRERSYAPTVQRRSRRDPVLYRIKTRNL